MLFCGINPGLYSAAIGHHFRTSEPAIERLDELLEVVDEAAAEMMGIAAIRVE